MSKFIKLTRSECGTEIMQNVDAIKRFSQYAEMGWTYVITTDGYELNVRETPEQILAQICGGDNGRLCKAAMAAVGWMAGQIAHIESSEAKFIMDEIEEAIDARGNP